jgi:hypothetical protein
MSRIGEDQSPREIGESDIFFAGARPFIPDMDIALMKQMSKSDVVTESNDSKISTVVDLLEYSAKSSEAAASERAAKDNITVSKLGDDNNESGSRDNQ